MSGAKQSVSIVLVHGAWADGSSWNDVIAPLPSRGLCSRGPDATDVPLSASFFSSSATPPI